MFALLIQLFINVGMTIGIAPVTGIPLPLVSYGGSSLITTLVMVGILESSTSAVASPGFASGAPPHQPDVGVGRPQGASRGRGGLPSDLVAGSPEHAEAVRTTFVEGGDAEAVRDISGKPLTAYDVEGSRVVVYAVDGQQPSEEDEKSLRLAIRKGVGVICVLVGVPEGELPSVPYDLDTDVVAVAPGEPLPIEDLAERIADRADEGSYQLAKRLPAVRPAIVEQIVKKFSLPNGVLGVAIFIPGADFPVLTLNQIRMVLRIAAANGEELDKERAVEILTVVAGRARVPDRGPAAGRRRPRLRWAVKGGIAYAATRAVGEAAAAYFAAGGTRLIGGPSGPGPSLLAHGQRGDARSASDRGSRCVVEYLEATQAEAATGRYDEVEPWAWARLNQRLRAVDRKRTGLRPAAA